MMKTSLLSLSLLLALGLSADGQERADETTERIRSHYRAVEQELLAANVSHLEPPVLVRRLALIRALADYRLRGEFTQGPKGEEDRVPYFVDGEGRHCAVANLLRETGEFELIDRVVRSDNQAWVADLEGVAAFQSWLDEVGLSFEEAARIQLPAVGGSGGRPPAEGSVPAGAGTPGRGDIAQPAPGTPIPSDTRGPGLGGPATGRGGSAGASGGGLSGPTTGGGAARTAALMGSTTEVATWWEFNKLRFLRPNSIERSVPVSGDGSASSSGGAVELARMKARKAVEAWLDAPQARVRARALMAHARLGGPSALAAVNKGLEDSAREVRLAAILALGLTDSEEAVHRALLLVQAEESTVAARAFALVALASLRSKGFGAGTEAMLASLVEPGDVDAEQGLILHQLGAPTSELEARLRGLAGMVKGAETNDVLRPRAVAGLRYDRGSDTLSALLDRVGSRSLPDRRAAALALASFEGASEPLRTAFELERDGLARGYLLASLGEVGGEPARDFLIKTLERGKSAQRPWAALALGRLAGDAEDDKARKALVKALRREKNRDNRGTLCLAVGLSGETDAAPLLLEELASKSTADRSRAALGLGLLGRPEDREALREALVKETSPLPRSALAQALALHGDERDAELLLAELEDVRDPLLQGQLAVALGFHGTLASVEGLQDMVEARETSAEARAAALDALGLALSGADSLFLARLSGHADIQSFPWWMGELLQFTL